MTRAEFAEKSYEIAYCAELYAGEATSMPIYSPSQVLEAILGFDAASDPSDTNPIWEILALPRPRGLRLLPENIGVRGAHNKLPTRPVSLILQFKVPEYLRGGRAKQWNLWHRPYFRFAKTNQQQQVLARLEEGLSGDVVVRYAAPAFYQQSELEIAQLGRLVIAQSGHVSPRELAKHRVWTFVGPGLDGRANPSGAFRPFEPLEVALAAIFQRPGSLSPPSSELQVYEGLRGHVSNLADSVRQRNPAVRDAVRRWAGGLRALDLSPQQTLDVVNFASVQTGVASVGAAWFLLDPEAS